MRGTSPMLFAYNLLRNKRQPCFSKRPTNVDAHQLLRKIKLCIGSASADHHAGSLVASLQYFTLFADANPTTSWGRDATQDCRVAG